MTASAQAIGGTIPAYACQTTLARPFTQFGIGMHTGVESRVSVRPASAGEGVTFVAGSARIPARAGLVRGANRCTSLGLGCARVDTVEHLLSALFGLRVDNAEVHVEGPELPILDGSALPWAESIVQAGIVDLGVPAVTLSLDQPLLHRSGESWLIGAPAPALAVTCVTRFDHPLLGTHAMSLGDCPDAFLRDVAPARTFGFAEEVDQLRAMGLARGGSLDNALVIHRDHFSSPLRLEEEWLRHKALDLLGDLSLAGCRISAAITAIMPGHRANVAFAAMLEGLAGRPDVGS